MKIGGSGFGFIALLLLAANLSAQQVRTTYDRSANFTQYKTYSWILVTVQDSLFADRIKSPINAALAAKGWTQLTSGGDVSITATEITSTREMHVSYDGVTGGSGWTPGPGGPGDTETFEVGTLVVDMFDAKTKRPLWRGCVKDTFSNNPNTTIKHLDKGVEKLFKNFPPHLIKK